MFKRMLFIIRSLTEGCAKENNLSTQNCLLFIIRSLTEGCAKENKLSTQNV